MNASVSAVPSRLAVWWNHHLHSLALAAGRAWQRPGSTALTVLVMALALALPLGLALVLAALRQFAGDVQTSRDINVFLAPSVEAAPARALAERLGARADVAAVHLRTPEQGLQELRTAAGLGAAIDALGENPLPTLLVVTPAAQADEDALAKTLGELEQVDLVQHDTLWRRRLDGWLGLGLRLVQVLGVLMLAAAVLVVGNTVRLDIQSRREEIGVLQLLGASDGFIRRPFLYLGAGYGLAAGALALALVAAAGAALRAPLVALNASYGSHFVLPGPSPAQVALVLVGTAVLGWLGAWLVAGHFLRQSRPTEI